MKCKPFEEEKHYAVNCNTGSDGPHYPGSECSIECIEGFYEVKGHLIRCEVVDGISMWLGKLPTCEC